LLIETFRHFGVLRIEESETCDTRIRKVAKPKISFFRKKVVVVSGGHVQVKAHAECMLCGVGFHEVPVDLIH
jgi:hypothetical protein